MTWLVRTMFAGRDATCVWVRKWGTPVDEFWSNGDKNVASLTSSRERAPRPFHIASRARRCFEAERSSWFLWLPVLLSCGIAIYFSLPVEPPLWAVTVLALVASCLVMGVARGFVSPIWGLCFAVALAGIGLGKLRTLTGGPGAMVQPYGIVELEGWLEHMEVRSNGRGFRLIVVPHRIETITSPQEIPYRVSLIWRGADVIRLVPGDFVRLSAKFLPPPGPVWPGGYDPAFVRWFKGIGASGFLLKSPEKTQSPAARPQFFALRAQVEAVRQAIGERIRSAVPGVSGAIAVALITGDRTGIPNEMRDSLREAGLAHLLAISGLHMAMFAGGVFWLLRALLSVNQALALRYPVKKWAAGAALVAAAGYLLLSGMGLATQRAFIMIAIMFLAIMIDRPALSMRNVALAALIILVVRPESVMSVSFQLSFFAVIALIAFYGFLETRSWGRLSLVPVGSGAGRLLNQLIDYLWSVGLTTLIAGLATAPIAAFHFNKAATYGLLGNLLAVPVVGTLVMPAAILALIAMPFGLEASPLWVMGLGISMVMWVADYVSALPGSVQMISETPAVSALLISFGFLWLCLWSKRWRVFGLGAIWLGVGLAPLTQNLPDVIISDTARQIAVKGPGNALVLSSSRSGRYSVERWLAKFGDPASFKQATARDGFSCDDFGCTIQVKGGHELALVRHPSILAEECARATIVVVTFSLKAPCPSAMRLVTRKDLAHQGVHAFFLVEESAQTGKGQSAFAIHQKTARSTHGARPWTAKPKRYRKRMKPAPKPDHPDKDTKRPRKQQHTPAPPVQVRI